MTSSCSFSVRTGIGKIDTRSSRVLATLPNGAVRVITRRAQLARLEEHYGRLPLSVDSVETTSKQVNNTVLPLPELITATTFFAPKAERTAASIVHGLQSKHSTTQDTTPPEERVWYSGKWQETQAYTNLQKAQKYMTESEYKEQAQLLRSTFEMQQTIRDQKQVRAEGQNYWETLHLQDATLFRVSEGFKQLQNTLAYSGIHSDWHSGWDMQPRPEQYTSSDQTFTVEKLPETYSGYKLHVYCRSREDIERAMIRLLPVLVDNNLNYKVAGAGVLLGDVEDSQCVKGVVVYLPTQEKASMYAEKITAAMSGWHHAREVPGDVYVGNGVSFRSELIYNPGVDLPYDYSGLYGPAAEMQSANAAGTALLQTWRERVATARSMFEDKDFDHALCKDWLTSGVSPRVKDVPSTFIGMPSVEELAYGFGALFLAEVVSRKLPVQKYLDEEARKHYVEFLQNGKNPDWDRIIELSMPGAVEKQEKYSARLKRMQERRAQKAKEVQEVQAAPE